MSKTRYEANGIIDVSLTASLISTAFCWLMIPEVNVNIAGVAFLILFLFGYSYLQTRKYFTSSDIKSNGKFKISMNLNDTLDLMYEANLEIKSKAGDYYIITTKYSLLPNFTILLQEQKDSCLIMGHKHWISKTFPAYEKQKLLQLI